MTHNLTTKVKEIATKAGKKALRATTITIVGATIGFGLGNAISDYLPTPQRGVQPTQTYIDTNNNGLYDHCKHTYRDGSSKTDKLGDNGEYSKNDILQRAHSFPDQIRFESYWSN